MTTEQMKHWKLHREKSAIQPSRKYPARPNISRRRIHSSLKPSQLAFKKTNMMVVQFKEFENA
jgi:hypothetical protein